MDVENGELMSTRILIGSLVALFLLVVLFPAGMGAPELIGLLLIAVPIPWQWQLIGFALLGVVAMLMYRSYARKHPENVEQPNLNLRGHQYIGSELVLSEPIEQGAGKAKLGDGYWKVSGPELPAGARVRVTGVNGTILTVIPA